MMKRFHRAFPGVRYELYEKPFNDVTDLLIKGIVELGIIRAPFDGNMAIDAYGIGHEQMSILFRREDVYKRQAYRAAHSRRTTAPSATVRWQSTAGQNALLRSSPFPHA